MFSTKQALKENGLTAVCIALAFIILIFGCVVNAKLSLETKIFVVSLVWVALYCLQRILVEKRRCSGHHWYVQLGAMAAYYLPTPLAFYAASAFYHSTTTHININECGPLLLCCILLIFTFTIDFSNHMGVIFTNMTAYSPSDTPRDRFNFIMWLVLLGRVGLDWEWSSRLVVLLPCMALLCCTAIAILFEQAPESTLDCETKVVADYMKRLKPSNSSSTGSPFFDANSILDCCRYPFLQLQGEDGEWVTVKDLVQGGDGEWVTVNFIKKKWVTMQDLVRRDDLKNENKDVWLSYSLSRLLARQYYGFHCAEEGDDMVRRFALADLGTREGCKRAFDIVDMQLAFLHDYFFTASLPIIQSGLGYIRAAQKVMLFIFIFITSIFSSGTSSTITVVTVTTIFIGLCALFEIPKSLVGKKVLPFYWRQIHTAFGKFDCLHDSRLPITCGCLVRLFRYIYRTDMEDVFDLFETKASGPYWSNRLGQYSIVQDYHRHRSLKNEFVAWFQGTLRSQPQYKFINHLPVEEKEVDIKDMNNLRELVAETLQSTKGSPTNGTESLERNMDELRKANPDYDWLSTCREETHTDIILIWHIATCECDIILPDDPEAQDHHESARALSKYCAYLVAFLPEFLPEHSLTTKQVFQRVLQEAKDQLGGKPVKEEDKKGGKPKEEDRKRTTFYRGVELGEQLKMIKEDRVRWRVIAQFWAETILYIAPSNNAEAHIEHLAKGGEFITHLWAMLSNAGILKRAEGERQDATATEEPPTHQLLEARSSSNVGPSTSSGPSSPIQTLEPTTNGEGKQVVEDHDK